MSLAPALRLLIKPDEFKQAVNNSSLPLSLSRDTRCHISLPRHSFRSYNVKLTSYLALLNYPSTHTPKQQDKKTSSCLILTVHFKKYLALEMLRVLIKIG